jgi:hypothetical protein
MWATKAKHHYWHQCGFDVEQCRNKALLRATLCSLLASVSSCLLKGQIDAVSLDDWVGASILQAPQYKVLASSLVDTHRSKTRFLLSSFEEYLIKT